MMADMIQLQYVELYSVNGSQKIARILLKISRHHSGRSSVTKNVLTITTRLLWGKARESNAATQRQQEKLFSLSDSI